MAYDLEVIVAKESLLERHSRRVPSMHVVPLTQGFALIPVTDAVAFDVKGEGQRRPRTPLPDDYFRELTAPVVAWLEDVSMDGPVAYVEIDCFGGDCDRGAVVWESGAIVLGPFPVDEETNEQERAALAELFRQDRDAFVVAMQARLPGLTTNRALRRLGVQRGKAGDEFNALGLGRHRHTSSWIATET